MFSLFLHRKLQSSHSQTRPLNPAKAKATRNSLAAKYDQRVEEFISAAAKELIREERLNRTAPAAFLDRFVRSPKDQVTEEQLFEMKAAYAFQQAPPVRLRQHLNSSWALETRLPKSSSGLRKTHFKGVLARTLGKPNLPNTVSLKPKPAIRKRAASDTTSLLMARDVLQSCHIIQPPQGPIYLRAGAGRLTSNPRQTTQSVYRRLYQGQLPCPSKFTL